VDVLVKLWEGFHWLRRFLAPTVMSLRLLGGTEFFGS
jgi:hypothetical protein